MKTSGSNNLFDTIEQYIKQSSASVFLMKDFADLGSSRQISNVLKKLIRQCQLAKIGYGLYAKAYLSPYLSTPLLVDGFCYVTREALDRLQVRWEPGSAEKEYNEGKTQQVPTQHVVRLKSRLRRVIRYEGCQLYYEKGINAR